MISRESETPNYDEIDLTLVAKFFLKNIKILIGCISLGLILGYLKYLNTPKTWQGEFQIVVSEEQRKLSPSTASGFISEAFRGEKSSGIDTQIIILESPSVLMDTFNFVKDSNLEEDLRFQSWKQRLEVKQIKSSSVLKIIYNDQKKEVILPVLEKISSLYQEYSNKKRVKSINFKIDYYKKQIKKFTELTYQSLLKTQDYSEKFAISRATTDDPKILLTDVELNSTKARMQLRELDQKLKKIKSIKDNEEFIYYAKIFRKSENLINQISKIESKILTYSTQYKDNDPIIIDLKNQREFIKNKIGIELISSLKAEIDNANVSLKANERKSDVIFNYKKLILENIKNSETVKNLESQLITMELEKARNTEPWDLITNPRLMPSHIAPSFSKHIFGGSVIALVFAVLALFVKEKNNKFISNIKEIKYLLNLKNTFILPLTSKEINKENFDLLKAYLKEKAQNKIILFEIDNKENLVEEIYKNLNPKNKENTYHIANKLSDFSSYKQLILILTLNKTSKKSIIELKNNLEILKIDLVGLIVIDNGNDDLSV